MAFASFDPKNAGAPMAEINMVPLIDVMLVLLVIFIVTAPLLTQAVKLELPKATSQANDLRPEKVEFAIDAAGLLYWNGEPVSRAEAQQRFLAEGKKPVQPEIHLKADQGVAYRFVAQTLADASKAGPDQGRLHQRSRDAAVSAMTISTPAARGHAAPDFGPARRRAAPRCGAPGRADRQRGALRRRPGSADPASRLALPPQADRPREAHPDQVDPLLHRNVFAPARSRQPVPHRKESTVHRPHRLHPLVTSEPRPPSAAAAAAARRARRRLRPLQRRRARPGGAGAPAAPASAASAPPRARPATGGTVLQPIPVKAKAETDQNSVRATTSTIGRGQPGAARRSAVGDRRHREADGRPPRRHA